MFKQAMGEREDYFDYVGTVLGVKTIYLESISEQQHIPLLVRVENLKSYSEEELIFLDKMLSALKIEKSNIKISDYDSKEKVTQDFLLCFLQRPQKQEAANCLETFSPRHLLNKAELKKQTWNELQKVIQFFSTSKKL